MIKTQIVSGLKSCLTTKNTRINTKWSTKKHKAIKRSYSWFKTFAMLFCLSLKANTFSIIVLSECWNSSSALSFVLIRWAIQSPSNEVIFIDNDGTLVSQSVKRSKFHFIKSTFKMLQVCLQISSLCEYP